MFTKIYAVYTSPRQPALYSPDECIKTKPIRNLLLSSLIMTSLMTLVGIGSAKIIGLEMFGVLQLSYFTLASHGNLDIYLEPLVGFKLFNGLNLNIEEESPVSLPLSISNLKLGS